MKWAEFAFLAGAMLLLGVVYEILPLLKKRNLYFGVTVEPAFRSSAEGLAIRREFRVLVWSAVALSMALAWWALGQPYRLLVGLSPVVPALAGMAAWVRAWSRTRPHAARIGGLRTAPLVLGEEHLPGGPATAVVPFAMLASAAMWLWTHYGELPERYPVHWGAAGTPDRWVVKSRAIAVAPALIGAGVLTVVLSMAWLILNRARRGSGGESGDFGSRHRMANVQMLAVTAWMLAALFSVVTLLPVLPPMRGWRMAAVMLAPIAVILGFAFRIYKLSVEETGGSDGTPEECWKFGAIYYNPADPALIVEKRSGPGFTLNFGRPAGWLIIAGLLLLVLGPLLLLK